jgi:iron complex transport system substrate-binding protein
MKRIMSSLLVAMMMLVMVGCQTAEPATEAVTETETPEVVAEVSTEIRFTDDLGKEILMDKPAETIISLYSVHTENLYALEAGDKIIGVGTSDKYPEDVLTKTQYSYKDDPELIIAANPDVLLIRTMIANRYPDFVKAIEDAGITVVTLYCSEYDKFDDYMNRLGLVVGQADKAAELVASFHEEVESVKAKAEAIENKKIAYFESIGSKFKTTTPESFAGTALTIVGLDNVAKDVEHDGSTTVVVYGEEALLAKATEIDVYIAQKGAMNKTVSLEEIEGRPGFSAIKAVKEGNVIIMDEKLISGATMRYVQGLKELQTAVYGE